MQSQSLLLLALLASGAFAQSVVLEPAQPLLGQDLTIHYNPAEGTLPDSPANVILHWALHDPATGNWSLPPELNWPAGSNSPDGFALQSPLIDDGDTWSVTLSSVVEMEEIAFVFTDGTANWDNNSGNNWIVSYMADDVDCWWSPEEPETGDLLTVYYNSNVGTVPSAVRMHWGINDSGAGSWTQPPSSIWPDGTVPWSDGLAVQSPMVDEGDGIWSLQIEAIDGVDSFHWVFTNGDTWDNNDGGNWNLFVGEPPVFADVWHRFIFDSRSTFFAGPRPVTQVTLAGTLNGWNMTANPLVEGPEGVWTTELVLSEGSYQYKFVVNGNNWTADPDNPLQNPDDNNNSMLDLLPAAAPRFTGAWPPAGSHFAEGEETEVAIAVRQPDGGEALNEASLEVLLNGSPVTHSFDGDSIRVTIPFADTGSAYWLELSIADVDGDTGSFNWSGSSEGEGWLRTDPAMDDDGPGSYSYTTPFDGYADLRSVQLLEAAGGDTMRVRIERGMSHDYSRIQLVLMPGLDAQAGEDLYRDELATPDWAENGIAMGLMNPTSSHMDEEVDNHLLYGHNPLSVGPALDVWTESEGSRSFLVANLPMDQLENRLGSWQEAWYIACWAQITGLAPIDGRVTELGPSNGALSESWDCDVLDVAFVYPHELENRLLGNADLSRMPRLDGAGRGFLPVTPEEVGPNMAAPGPVVRILTLGGETVQSARTIRGEVTANAVGDLKLVRDWTGGSDTLTLAITDGEWSTSLQLQEGLNTFQAWAVDGEGFWGSSATMEFTWVRNHAPQPGISMLEQEEGLRFYGTSTVDIDGDIVSRLWEPLPENPEAITIQNSDQIIALMADYPTTDGEYWVRHVVEDAAGNVGEALCMFEVEHSQLLPVSSDGYPTWVRDAIVYEIYVRSFDAGRTLNDVTARLDEIADLGVNTIWFMPVNEGPSDHGYAISDYYAIEADYGTLEDFQNLVNQAHDRGLRVVMDAVLNHSSIDHPWMIQALAAGTDSPYYSHYMFNPDGTHQYYYDWYSLPNFNVSDADLKWRINTMCKYWVEDVGVDGFRCDVAWGPMERDAQYWNDWRKAIRAKRPDLFLLAEAGANDFSIFDNRFNLAYDWDLFWQAFGNFETVAPSTLQDRLSNFGFWYPDNALPFRFLENHDENRYIADHGLEVTRCAAGLLFAVPGVPLIYAGQEVGETSPRGLINWSDPDNLRSYYQLLCETRSRHEHFRTQRMEQVTSSVPSQIYAFTRGHELPGNQGLALAAFNLSGNQLSPTLNLSPAEWGMAQGVWYLTDLFTGDVIEFADGVPETLELDFGAWEPRWFLLADEVAEVGVEGGAVSRPLDFQLSEPWPNPFNPVLNVELSLPVAGDTKVAVYNMLGQQVDVIQSGMLAAGEHRLSWNGAARASGLYLIRAEQAGKVSIRKALLVR